MLLARIQKDLFDFTDKDPEDFEGLVEFWYRENGEALSAALTAHKGLNLILNVNSFANFELLAKRLFLIADTLILRDVRDWATDKPAYRDMPVPTGGYRPGHLPDTLEELKNLRPSPFTLLHRPTLYWTSTSKLLNNGLHVVYAGGGTHPIPSEFFEWLGGVGRPYLQTGQIVYAPFIPSIAMELEFLKNNVNLPAHFGAASLFHQQHEWLSDSQLKALLSLNVPFLDGLNIETISEVKRDNYDAFSSFSRTLVHSMHGLKSAYGTEGFVSEVRHIQRHQIDAALSDVEKTVKRVNQSAALRKQGILTGLVGLNAATFMGLPETSVITGLATGAAALVAERLMHLRERNEISDKNGYFLWQLRSASCE